MSISPSSGVKGISSSCHTTGTVFTGHTVIRKGIELILIIYVNSPVLGKPDCVTSHVLAPGFTTAKYLVIHSKQCCTMVQ